MKPQPPIGDIVRLAAFYPSEIVVDRLIAWRWRNTRCALHLSFASALSIIRRTLMGSDVVLIDATSRRRAAEIALREAIERPGGYCTAVYSEAADYLLESMARQQGSWFLLGPLPEAEWEKLLDKLCRYVDGMRNLPAAGARPGRLAGRWPAAA